MLLIEDEVEVLCHVEEGQKSGSAPINAGSILLEMLDAEGASTASAPGMATGAEDEYGAEFVVATLPSGPVSFRCSASDRADPPRSGADTVNTFFDDGPRITVRSPEPDSPQRQGPVRFEFAVEPEALAESDRGAEVLEVTLEVEGKMIERLGMTSNVYSADIDLTDRAVFNVPPTESAGVTIQARNRRGVKSRKDYRFFVDGTPPMIQIVSPSPLSVVPSRVDLVFTVADSGVGVDRDTIVVEVNGEEFRYDHATWSVKDDEFAFTFESTQIENTEYQLTINVRASDLAGNKGETGASVNYYIDNFPPFVSLDPLDVREIRPDPTVGDWCSQPFDPLGSAISDWGNGGKPTRHATMFRAMVWDYTNGGDPNQTVKFLAGVGPDDVYLYLQSDLNAPFLVDTNEDGICDDIEAREDLPFQRLAPIAPKGLPLGGPIDRDAAPAVQAGLCVSNESSSVPEPICGGASELTRIVGHNAIGRVPVIYAVSPVDSLDHPACDGVDWDVWNVVHREGWVCAAARAEDRVHNVGISKPLRLCLSDGEDPPADCEVPNARPPSCLSGCEMKNDEPRQPLFLWPPPNE